MAGDNSGMTLFAPAPVPARARDRVLAALVALAAALWAPAALPASADSCVRVVPRQGGENLVNQCDSCRQVSVLRMRTGAGANPTQRTFVVQGGMTMPMPFRGTGRSRITGETPCEGVPGGPTNLVNPKAAAPAPGEPLCVQLYRAGGAIAMVNPCAVCRLVTVERHGANGGSARTAYAINAKSQIPLDPLGAASAKLVGETACR